jgi:hypothetical protein
MVQMQPSNKGSTSTQSGPLTLARYGVRDLLIKSPSFRALPPARQQEIAKNTVQIVKYLAAPEGIPGNEIAAANKNRASTGPLATGLEGENQEGTGDFTAYGAREGAKVAGLLLQEVNFPAFVTGLIDGVFTSIVTSSINQMEAYGRLVADVAKTLNQFRDENVTDNQGRDHLIDQFPDLFQLDVDTGENGETRPRVRLREEVDESDAINRVNDSLPTGEAPLESLDLEDDDTEHKLVQAARTQLASSRQQLLATMVLMGINRIILTSGKIAAKVKYRFQASDQFQKSATSFDYKHFGTQYSSQGQFSHGREGGEYSKNGDEVSAKGASYWVKGRYKTSQQPYVKISNIEASQTDAQLQTAAQLAGEVNVNFKSETLPLERMADSFQIGRIQEASKRNRPDSEPAT